MQEVKKLVINSIDIKITDIDGSDKVEIENQLRNIVGLYFKYLKWFNASSLHIENAEYGNSQYLSEDKLRKIRNEIIQKLSRLHTLKSYNDVILTSNLLSGLHSKNYYLFVSDTIKKGVELFIKGCKFNDKEFLDKKDFKNLSLELQDVLNEIDGVEFADICVYNVISKNKHFIINIKDTTFFGDRIYSNNSEKFKNGILNVLESINDLDTEDTIIEFKFY